MKDPPSCGLSWAGAGIVAVGQKTDLVLVGSGCGGPWPIRLRRRREVIAAVPGFHLAYVVLSRALMGLARHRDALHACQAALRLTPHCDIALTTLAITGARLSPALAGATLRVLETATSTSPYLLAKAYAAMGQVEASLDLLEQGVQERTTWLTDLPVDPELQVLHGHPRFEALALALTMDGEGGATR